MRQLHDQHGLPLNRIADGLSVPATGGRRLDQIRSAVEGSLKRLRTDHIDLYYQHRVGKRNPSHS